HKPSYLYKKRIQQQYSLWKQAVKFWRVLKGECVIPESATRPTPARLHSRKPPCRSADRAVALGSVARASTARRPRHRPHSPVSTIPPVPYAHLAGTTAQFQCLPQAPRPPARSPRPNRMSPAALPPSPEVNRVVHR